MARHRKAQDIPGVDAGLLDDIANDLRVGAPQLAHIAFHDAAASRDHFRFSAGVRHRVAFRIIEPRLDQGPSVVEAQQILLCHHVNLPYII